MSLPIAPVQPVTPLAAGNGARGAAAAKSGEFSSLLQGAIQGIERPRAEANHAVQSLLNGDGEELHTAALAVQKAELAFEFGLQVRNKVVSAYQEVMRMQM